MGLLITVVVHAANIQDRDGARLVFKKIRKYFTRLKLIWADGGYAGKLIYYANTEKMDGLLECGMASYPVSAIRILDLETGTHKLTIEDKNSKFDIMKWLPDSQNLVFTKSKSVQEKDPNSECYTGEYTDSEKFIFDIKMMKIVYNSFESEILKIWKNKNIPVVIQENSDNVLYLSGKEIDRSEKIIILNK